MQTRSVVCLMGIVAVGAGLLAQHPPPPQKTEGARDLYYFGATQKEPLPPIRKVSTGAKGARSAPAGAQSAVSQPGGVPVPPGTAV